MHNYNRSSFETISYMQLKPQKSALIFSIISLFSFFLASTFTYKLFYDEALARPTKGLEISIKEPRIDKESIISLSKLKKSENYSNLYNEILLSKNSSKTISFRPDSRNDDIKLNLTWNPELQSATQILLDKMNISWGSIVAIEPQTGKILAIASRQEDTTGPLALRSTFPAASVFKIVTASAAVERKGLDEYSVISYRGGNYTLNKSNYSVSNASDTRRMLLGEALGKSVNPVFGRLALGVIGNDYLKTYAESFLFNKNIPFDFKVQKSLFMLPKDDLSLARTGAGFESSFVSPLHAALMVSAFANKGKIMKPYLIEGKEDKDGNKEQILSSVLVSSILESTANEVNEMMEYTTTSGTARRYFKNYSSDPKKIAVGKTGTLSGKTPEGRYHWFVGFAPKDNPKVAISALVIDKGKAKVNGSGLARAFLDSYNNIVQ